MKNILLVLAAIFSVAFVTGAEATPFKAPYRTSSNYGHYTHKTRTHVVSNRQYRGRSSVHRAGRVGTYTSQRKYHARRETSRIRSSQGIGGRPRAWCGWYMRTIFGGGPEYNLAANWRHRGSPTSPHAGAVVVWPHHVGVIVGGCSGGRCLVKSGNYANRVAIVQMRVSNAIAFRDM